LPGRGADAGVRDNEKETSLSPHVGERVRVREKPHPSPLR
jgi:hypothetical protein